MKSTQAARRCPDDYRDRTARDDGHGVVWILGQEGGQVPGGVGGLVNDAGDRSRRYQHCSPHDERRSG